jgi:hypothetical protein
MNQKAHYLTPVNGMSTDYQNNVQNEASSQCMCGGQREELERINKAKPHRFDLFSHGLSKQWSNHKLTL